MISLENVTSLITIAFMNRIGKSFLLPPPALSTDATTADRRSFTTIAVYLILRRSLANTYFVVVLVSLIVLYFSVTQWHFKKYLTTASTNDDEFAFFSVVHNNSESVWQCCGPTDGRHVVRIESPFPKKVSMVIIILFFFSSSLSWHLLWCEIRVLCVRRVYYWRRAHAEFAFGNAGGCVWISELFPRHRTSNFSTKEKPFNF